MYAVKQPLITITTSLSRIVEGAGAPASTSSLRRKTMKAITSKMQPTSVLCQISQSTPPQHKVEVIKSIEPWACENVLCLLKPIEKSWQPSQFLPDPTLPDDDFHDKVQDLRKGAKKLPDDYFVVLVGDLITEEGLPTYQSMINRCNCLKDATGSSQSPWAIWTRGWTAEENRHGDLLKSYLYLSGRVDMVMIEKTVHYMLSAGMDVGVETDPYLGLVYTAFQERATFISHGNTAKQAKEHGDQLLASICRTIAADEKRHEIAYSKVVGKLLEVDPNETMLAIGKMMRRGITMPAHLMHDGQDPNLFKNFSLLAKRTGIYTPSDYVEILEFLIKHWGLEKIEGLKGEGMLEQEHVCNLAPRLKKLIERDDSRPKEAMKVNFSWIFNNEVTI